MPGPGAVPFPYGKMRQPPYPPSLEEQVRELTKKVKWERLKVKELEKKLSKYEQTTKIS